MTDPARQGRRQKGKGRTPAEFLERLRTSPWLAGGNDPPARRDTVRCESGAPAAATRSGRHRGAPGANADRPADGSGRVRRRRARQRARLFRPLGAARRAAPGLRRLARRQQGQQLAEGGAHATASTPRATSTTHRQAARRSSSRRSCSGTSTTSSCSTASRQGAAFLNDPAQGPRVVSHEELDEAFSGVVLDLHARPGVQAGRHAARPRRGAARGGSRL